MFLDGILKGLVLWIYGLILEGVEYMADSLLNIFSLDLAYFETYAPVVNDIQNIVIAVGWALLIGNLVFQAMRSMAAGLGFEGEDPVTLGTRTFVFAFLLLASRQICAIGLNFTSAVMDLFQVPDAVEIITPDENAFGIDSSWLLAMIVGLILIFQVIKFFFEIGERYVVTVILVVLAPLAFGMGGSKNTEDIFKGWCRMFGSMCVMMLMNVIFLKLLLSTMSTVPSGLGIFPWLIFVTAIVRVGRKIDDIVCRMGLNPAHTGSPLGKGYVGGLTSMVAHQGARMIMQTVSANRAGSAKNPSSGNRSTNRPNGGPVAPGPSPSPSPSPAGGGNGGTASGQTAGTPPAAGSSAGTPPNGKTQEPPKAGGQATPTAAPKVPQGQPGTPAPEKKPAQKEAAPTRPPLGRGRKFTPPTAGQNNPAAEKEKIGKTPPAPATVGTPGQPGSPGHPAPQAAPASAESKKNVGTGQQPTAPLNAQTPVPKNTITAGDSKKTESLRNSGTPTHPAPPPQQKASNTPVTPSQQGGTTPRTPAGTPGTPGSPGRTVPPVSTPIKPKSAAETVAPATPPQPSTTASSGVPVRNAGAVSGGTNQHEPYRAPVGISSKQTPPSTPETDQRPPRPNPPIAASQTKEKAKEDAPGRPGTPGQPATPPILSINGFDRKESQRQPSDVSDKARPGVQTIKPSTPEDKKSNSSGDRPPRPEHPK